MNDYLFVFSRIKDVLAKYGLSELYPSYATTLHSINVASTPELQTALKDFKARIKQAHEEFASIEWTTSQRRVLARLGADKILGGPGLRSFKEALTEKGVNPEGAVADVQKLGEPIIKLFNKVTLLLIELQPITEESEQSLPTGYMSVELTFNDETHIDTVPEWKDQAESWYLIAYAAKLLDKEHPVDLELPQMSKNSPLGAVLCGPYVQIATVSSIFFLCLKLYEKVLNIVKLHYEIDKLEVAVEKEKVDLELKVIEKEKALKEAEIKAIVNRTLTTFGAHLDESGRNTASNALDTATNHMYDYVKNGGELQFKERTPDPENEAMEKFEVPDIQKLQSDVKQLKQYFEFHRQLEAKNKTVEEKEKPKKENLKTEKERK